MGALSHGSTLQTALTKGFGGRFASVDALDREFADYAERKLQPLAGN
jgi:hypothetical protein